MDRLTRFKWVRRCSQIFLGVALLAPLTHVESSNAESPVSHLVDDREAKIVAAERALLEGLGRGAQAALSDGDQSLERDIRAELQPLALKSDTHGETKDTARIIVRKEISGLHGASDLTSLVAQQQPESGLKNSKTKSLGESSEKPSGDPERSSLRRELEASKRQVLELERQLEELKGQLSMAETELSRMATISEARNRASLARLVSPAPQAKDVVETQLPQGNERRVAPPIEPLPSSSDLMIVTVSVEKAELRLGPGKNHSALMTVSRGSRLAVEARQGEWYRVFAPNGQRAWILTKLVAVGDRSNAGQGASAVRVKGYNSSLEDEAFRRVQGITGVR